MGTRPNKNERMPNGIIFVKNSRISMKLGAS